MKKLFLFFALMFISVISPKGFSSENHHEEDAEHDEAEEKSHEEKEGHAHSDKDADEHEEGSAAVGPDKGILEKGPLGIKLSPEAIQTFSLKFLQPQSSELEIPKTALVEIKDGYFVYALTDNWISRIKVRVVSKNQMQVKISLPDFKPSQQIVVQGVGFVRGAELIAAEGATHSH